VVFPGSVAPRPDHRDNRARLIFDKTIEPVTAVKHFDKIGLGMCGPLQVFDVFLIFRVTGSSHNRLESDQRRCRESATKECHIFVGNGKGLYPNGATALATFPAQTIIPICRINGSPNVANVGSA